METPESSLESQWMSIELMVKEIVELQQKKVLQAGRYIIPNLTSEDVLQPVDYPALENDPHFRYEEGILGGIHTVDMALRALKSQLQNKITTA